MSEVTVIMTADRGPVPIEDATRDDLIKAVNDAVATRQSMEDLLIRKSRLADGKFPDTGPLGPLFAFIMIYLLWRLVSLL